jgi:hypothetical protein
MAAPQQPRPDAATPAQLTIYVSGHCEVCRYAYDVAARIRGDFPQVAVRLVDLETTQENVPEEVFATPTYLLNGRVWSLGNPSPEQVQATFQALIR